MMMHHNDNTGYWLDSLFNIIQQPTETEQRIVGSKYKQRSLEEQFNILSKLIVLSFFIFLTMHNFRTSLTITLSLLLLVSVTYYILDQIFAKRENFDEEEEPTQMPPNERLRHGTTSVNHINLNFERNNNRDIYLAKRPTLPENTIKYKELLPLHTFYERSFSNFQNPNLIEDIPYIEKIYGSNHWKLVEPPRGDDNDTPKNTKRSLVINPGASSSRYMIKSNIEHIAGDELEFDQLNRQSHDSYLMNSLDQRQLYSDQLTKLNRSRGYDQQLSHPINRNITTSVGRIGGGTSGSSSYYGPRG